MCSRKEGGGQRCNGVREPSRVVGLGDGAPGTVRAGGPLCECWEGQLCQTLQTRGPP